MARNTYQLGWGRRSRLLDSTFTDQTSVVGAMLARDKLACSATLREAGLPVPHQRRVRSADEAVRAAENLGYPVVVKPADQDGGRGVRAGLEAPEAVRRAYEAASALSQTVLVEEFLAGQDYRLQVFRDQVFWVVHRRPASVVGDGARCIRDLIEQTNHIRALAKDSGYQTDPQIEQGFSSISIDDEVIDWLARQGLSSHSVPPAGATVRLRGAANVALGGTRRAVLHEAHPDNLALAIKAASVLRLDLAGVDLIVPDIRRSWKEAGGGICEVNAQPQLSEHLPSLLLPKLVAGHGRIPTIVLVGLPQSLVDRDEVERLLTPAQRSVAWISEESAVRHALADPQVDGVVWSIDALPDSRVVSPFDVFDLLIAIDSADDSSRRIFLDSARPGFSDRARSVWKIEADLIGRNENLRGQIASRISGLILQEKWTYEI